MTYRELLDAAIGDPPPTAIDLDQVIKRQRRLIRVRRAGVCGVAAAAVLAVTLGAGLMVDGSARKTGVLPAVSPSPATVVPTDPRMREVDSPGGRRFQAAVTEALRREAPELRWVVGVQRGDPDVWSKPTQDAPSLSFYWAGSLRSPGFQAFGAAIRGETRGRIGISVQRPVKKAEVTSYFRCSDDPLWQACGVSTGPGGEQVRYLDGGVVAAGSPPPGGLPAARRIDVLRPDGTYLKVQYGGNDAQFLLSVEQMTRIALDPAIAAS
ncbi:hypothetical protein Q2K19_10210 [Micromonospora soli]|uniref:hypothetical protein n=1 Tax=Micromonospora sp. NBRC 110009 TaxID=3061627 RepID=UPI0026721CFF|nr:hypothetical protein [Micromonospora sp. NBRC 110009]WKU00814.1 hypothetical protein Q2K19_10210 [Micromonospora sp. NBRC 110009]